MFKVKIVSVSHFNGSNAGDFGNILNHCENEDVRKGAIFGFLYACKYDTVLEAASLPMLADMMIRVGYAGTLKTVGNRAVPNRFRKIASECEWGGEFVETIAASYDDEKYTWVNLSWLNTKDRESFLAILNRIEVNEGYGELAYEDYAILYGDPGEPCGI